MWELKTQALDLNVIGHFLSAAFVCNLTARLTRRSTLSRSFARTCPRRAALANQKRALTGSLFTPSGIG
jgi:hypothetical protein